MSMHQMFLTYFNIMKSSFSHPGVNPIILSSDFVFILSELDRLGADLWVPKTSLRWGIIIKSRVADASVQSVSAVFYYPYPTTSFVFARLHLMWDPHSVVNFMILQAKVNSILVFSSLLSKSPPSVGCVGKWFNFAPVVFLFYFIFSFRCYSVVFVFNISG